MKTANARGISVLLSLLTLIAPGMYALSDLKADLIIVGPGDPLYTYWGHIGIALEDRRTGESLFYDFGNFSFNSDHFYRDFALGRMMYLGYVVPTGYFLDYSLTENRDLTVYPLDLGDAELEELNGILRWWVKPENREYLYEYFRNNCSTIIRDILDEVTGRELENFASTRPDLTFRHYARTGADPSFFAELLVHFLLGPGQDEPISGWDRMFLPQAVADIGREFRYTGSDGTGRVLVGDPVVLKRSDRRPVPDRPRRLWPAMLMAGFASAFLWILAGHASSGPARRVGTAFRVVLSLFVGISGGALAFLMFATDHFSTYGNLNLGPACPTVLIAAAVLLLPSGRKSQDQKPSVRNRREHLVAWIWTINLIGLIGAATAVLSGLSYQDSGAFWAFFAPLTLAASMPGRLLYERLSGESRPAR